MVYLDELEGKKEQNEAVIKKTQDRVKELEAESLAKDQQLSDLERVRREQEKAATELQRSYALQHRTQRSSASTHLPTRAMLWTVLGSRARAARRPPWQRRRRRPTRS